MSTTREIYNNKFAGLNAYQLLEELSDLPGAGGWVELHKTLRHSREGEREYPPVYKIVYKPGFWDSITPAQLQFWDDIAKRYNCTPKFTARNGGVGSRHPECVIIFEHGRKDKS